MPQHTFATGSFTVSLETERDIPSFSKYVGFAELLHARDWEEITYEPGDNPNSDPEDPESGFLLTLSANSGGTVWQEFHKYGNGVEIELIEVVRLSSDHLRRIEDFRRLLFRDHADYEIIEFSSLAP